MLQVLGVVCLIAAAFYVESAEHDVSDGIIDLAIVQWHGTV